MFSLVARYLRVQHVRVRLCFLISYRTLCSASSLDLQADIVGGIYAGPQVGKVLHYFNATTVNYDVRPKRTCYVLPRGSLSFPKFTARPASSFSYMEPLRLR